jgi:hypothetical protein
MVGHFLLLFTTQNNNSEQNMKYVGMKYDFVIEEFDRISHFKKYKRQYSTIYDFIKHQSE